MIARMIRGNEGGRLLPPARLLLTAGMVLALLVTLGGCHNDSDEAEGVYDATNKADCLPAIKLLDQHDKPVVLSSFKGKGARQLHLYVLPGAMPYGDTEDGEGG